jgi:hypothetical protein
MQNERVPGVVQQRSEIVGEIAPILIFVVLSSDGSPLSIPVA